MIVQLTKTVVAFHSLLLTSEHYLITIVNSRLEHSWVLHIPGIEPSSVKKRPLQEI